jgi:iron uptake system EfeUOB component EfeO/EfeM
MLGVVAVLACACASPTTARTGGSGTTRIRAAARPAAVTTAAESTAASAATATFHQDLDRAASEFVTDVGQLRSAVDTGSVVRARADELAGQAAYDQFRELESGNGITAATLDELATDVGPHQSFGGLHAVERDLWSPGGSTADAGADISGLVAQAPVAQYLLAKDVLSPEAIGTTGVDELGWTVDTAIPGREEVYSHLDDVDTAATVAAADDAFVAIEPLSRLVAPAETAVVTASFARLWADVDRLGSPGQVVDRDISPATRLALSRQADATAAELARLSGVLAPFGTAGPPS